MDAVRRIGFVGIGQMGRPMAARLVQAGFDVVVYDARREAVRSFVERYGGRGATSLAEVGRVSDAVITMLPDGDVVRQVVLGRAGAAGDHLASALRPGTVLVDMSSSSPVGTPALGEALAQRGVAMLDAPVSGGVQRAETGTLAIMVGGDPAVVDRLRPVLETLGQRIFLTGPLGSGHALKALNNLVSAAGLIATAEALLIGRRFGLSPQVMIDVFNSSTARNNSTENKFKQFILSGSYASGFALDLMVKDLTTALELARATDTPAPFSAVCRELWAAARAQLGSGQDHTAVVRWFESLAGTSLAGGD